MEETSSVALLVPHTREQQDVAFAPELGAAIGAQRQAADSLIQVIEKLSKIVEKRPRRCTLSGRKRPHLPCASVPPQDNRGEGEDAPSKKARGGEGPADGASGEDRLQPGGAQEACGHRTVTCYQCSLCRFTSPALSQLKEHLQQHDEQQNDIILVCSECCFTSRQQEELEAHIREHLGGEDCVKDDASELRGGTGKGAEFFGEEASGPRASAEDGEAKAGRDGAAEGEPAGKKWYSYEQYGMYRCLICSYVCGQQRMLKTHAWKHAGLVDCSYPIFEDESERPSAQAPAPAEEAVVVLAPEALHHAPSFQISLCPVPADCQEKPAEEPEEANAPKVPEAEEPVVEVQVTTEQEQEQESSSMDSLLTSAQKIISCSSNGAGHVNVIVERLPGAEEPGASKPFIISPDTQAREPFIMGPDTQASKPFVMSPDTQAREPIMDPDTQASKPFVMSPDTQAREPFIMGPDTQASKPIIMGPDTQASKPIIMGPDTQASKPFLMSPDTQASKRLLVEEAHPVYYEEEVVIGWCHGDPQQGGAESPEDPAADENVPPARRRTHSESLRLHSLAAEALVAMPTRMPELMKAGIKGVVELSAQGPGAGPRFVEIASAGEGLAGVEDVAGGTAALVGLELQASPRRDSGAAAAAGEGPAKAGISVSLLTVIEKLRERTDQNASDEDILKELQDNAQSQPGGEGAAPDAGLVEFVPDSDRPYRCRLCRYSSGNKGYIKQHLRVHRQRQPYQCPICEHIAQDSKDLESHMINHCKTRMYHCKQCADTFYYKSQLRNHERDQHGLGDSTATLIPVTETTAAMEESEEKAADEDACSVQKIYKCDVCDYSSSTYVGVRNHRRVHNSDKPYRCCSCDFATTNMNSLKSHMRRHPQEHQAVQLLEQYRCSMCGYVCSHPPSLKSHMWKHAGDQNYNYEQVNKAINEAISQSSRSPSMPQKSTAVLEQACALSSGTERATPSLDPPAATSLETGGAGAPVTSAEVVQHSSPAGGTPSAPEKGAAHPRVGMEYCVLLFCCCICGFESPSKERLMEHMKEHEGEIISIILNKEQQQGVQAAAPGTGH
ncbi:zinc finger protein 507 [Anguilla anguilla]|uniref:zinc finger protein 507 n=1 Tax=Anguilla anguilla TaxID=7936 RepID=UPI0015AF7767|nr:zinc finger protein 507 [Anguilla anguilla]